MGKNQMSISPAEMTVLKVLWESGPMTVREMCDTLVGRKQAWAYTTVQTLMNRLVSKGVAQRKAAGVAHQYAPVVSRKRLLAARLKDLANQFCDGAASPLIAALVGEEKFTPEELAGFRKLLDEAEESKPKRKSRGRRG